MKIILFFNGISPWIMGVFILSLLFTVAYVDDVTGYEIGFSFFYLIPISLATLRFGKRGGLPFSLLAAFSWVVSDIDSGHHYSHPYFSYLNGLVRLGVFLVVAYLLGSLREEWEKEARFSQRDPLTDVLNRRAFEERAGGMLEKCRAEDQAFAFGYLDLDNFKKMNDSFGHWVGDEILKRFAQTLRKVRHPEVLIGRLGGDEFILLLAGIDEDGAKKVFDDLRSQVAEQLKNTESGVTVSIGVAAGRETLQPLSVWVKRADHLMYESKRSGKNKMSFSNFPN